MLGTDLLFALEGHELVGRNIRKVFNIGPFYGRTVGWRYTGGEFIFRVVYEDNDVEDLSQKEVEELIKQAPSSLRYLQKNQNGDLDMAVLRWKNRREKCAAAVRHFIAPESSKSLS
jgi:hypothetical protein